MEPEEGDQPNMLGSDQRHVFVLQIVIRANELTSLPGSCGFFLRISNAPHVTVPREREGRSRGRSGRGGNPATTASCNTTGCETHLHSTLPRLIAGKHR